jgi:arylsulfatase A-like enzyme
MRFISCLLIFSSAFHAASGQAASGAGEQPPNILLIVAEDMSARVGAYGDAVARTPSIDSLAREGVRYTNAFAAAGVCAPNRSALITGVYPMSMGTQHMRTSQAGYEAVPPPGVKAFPELLRRAGYATANVAKTDYQFGEPFTVWDVNVGGFAEPPDLAVWRRLPGEKPFFAMVNLMSTHESRLAIEGTGADGRFGEMLQAIVATRRETVEEVTDPDDVAVPPYYPDTSTVRASIARHYDNIHFMDGEVGRILANLEADGLADETIVIWTTDHGDGLPRAKRAVYDSGLHVPLIIRYPDSRGEGTARNDLVSVIDLAPAILALAGVEAPDFVQGRNFLAGPPREYVHAGRDRMDDVSDRVRAVRDGRYKYIRNYMPEAAYFRPLTFRDMFPVMQALWADRDAGTLAPRQAFYFTAPRPAEELYDTTKDPHEVRNLAGNSDHAETLARLRAEMDRWLAAVGDRSAEPETEMVASMWPGGEQPATAAPEVMVRVDGDGPRHVALGSETPGASVGYRIVDSEPNRGWQLYTRPVTLLPGAVIEAKAIRYGYAESPIVSVGD